ncbi:phosphatidylserine decarboxylase, putative [Bodo saltans]|uniref:Phosphatidylserine decarboxylase, putative n=1 Tax=Bodo saltans TaxID=75058 RepID=A0A0S4JU42_BODSA|nr:phosphatidylserine decarboxylase, putative [Bodo saltans]|eukprot:CUG94097.1 phosphatidylserine decarboxylase, putative [Bodo saltans]
MVSQSEWSLINNAQYLNEDRVARSREFVGVLYFILALSMLQMALLTGAVQGYVLPLRRFYKLNTNLVNNKVSTGIHCVFVTSVYFIVTGAAGASGYIFMSCLIGFWLFLMLVYIAVRKLLQYRAQQLHDQNLHMGGHHHSGEVTGSQDIASQGGAASSRRHSAQDLHASASFDFNFDSQSFDQVSLGSNDVNYQAMKNRMKKLTKAYGSWTACPKPMGPSQLTFTLLMVLGAVLVVCIFIGVFFGWKVHPYYVVEGGNSLKEEYQPTLNGKSIQMLYAFPGIATQFQFQLYVRLFTTECGKMYTKSVSDKKKAIYDSWIEPYGINMSQFIPSDYNAYDTVDQWFTRAINPALRPLPLSEIAVISPADCRLLVFEQSSDMSFFLKGYTVTISTLLGNFNIDGYPSYFDNAAVAVSRLAPQDYHRFHAPVSGKVISVTRIGGTYWSVNADATQSGNNVFLNARTVVVIDAGPRLGYVAVVGIGATCVGSVQLDLGNVTIGSEVTRGEPIGSMHFGGSTVLVLFSRGRIVFDQILLQRSRYGVETLVNVNSEIGSSR